MTSARLPEGTRFEVDYFERLHGGLVMHPLTAITELVANAWDAASTYVHVEIIQEGGGEIVVRDDGSGMNAAEFNRRWMTLGYNRSKHQGDDVEFFGEVRGHQRKALGRNGVGRHGLFAFGDEYRIETCKDGRVFRATVVKAAGKHPFAVSEQSEDVGDGHGTLLRVRVHRNMPEAKDVRAALAARFAPDPFFVIHVNGERLPGPAVGVTAEAELPKVAKATLEQMVKEPGAPSASSRHMRVDAAEERRAADIQARITLGDIADSAGRWRDAISAYDGAAKAATSEPARSALLAKSAAVKARRSRRMTVRWASAIAVMVIIGVGSWLATRSPAIDPARQAIAAEVSTLERMARDSSVDWVAVLAEAKRLQPISGDEAPRVRIVLDMASPEAERLELELAGISSVARIDPVQALARSDRFRLGTDRLGALEARLPLPGSIDVHGPESANVTIEVDGIPMPATAGVRFCRRAKGTTKVAILAAGYRPTTLVIAGDPSPNERVYSVTMADAPTWSVAGDVRDWAQLIPRGDAFLDVSARAIAMRAPGDGSVIARIEQASLPEAPKPGFAWLPCRDHAADRLLLCTDDGLACSVPIEARAFGRGTIVLRGAPASLTFAQRELLFHVGKQGCFTVHKTARAYALTARSDGQELWSFALTGNLEPWMSVGDESEALIDDKALYVLDQEGQLLESIAFQSLRSGPVASLDGGACLVIPTATGACILRRTKGHYRVLPCPSLDLRDARFAGAGRSLLAGSGERLQSLAWTGDGFSLVWAADLPKDHQVSVLSLSDSYACCCDQRSRVTAYELATGNLLRAVQLADSTVAPPLVLGGTIIATDERGISGYAIQR